MNKGKLYLQKEMPGKDSFSEEEMLNVLFQRDKEEIDQQLKDIEQRRECGEAFLSLVH